MMHFDPRADAGAVVQDDAVPDLAPAPVAVSGPVRVQMLPRVSAGMMTVQITGTPKRVLTADPRRARAVLLPKSQDVYFGASGNESAGGYGAWWPQALPLEIQHTEEVWVSCAVGNSTDMTVIVENWTG